MLTKEALENRARNFQTHDFEDVTRRRAQEGVELRKQSRSEQVAKRRMRLSQNSTTTETQKYNFHALLISHNPRLATASDLEQVDILASIINSPPDSLLFNLSIDALRYLMTSGEEAVMQRTVDCGVIPVLVNIAGSASDLNAYHALWCLSNICSGKHELTEKVLDCGVLRVIPTLLTSSSVDMLDQVVWILCNITADCVKYRDSILKLGYPAMVFSLLHQPQFSKLIPTLVWFFANICRVLPLPSNEVIFMGLKVALRCFQVPSTPLAVYESCVICDKATFEGHSDIIDMVLSLQLTPHLIELIQSKDANVSLAALRAYANLLQGTAKQTDAVLDEGVLDLFDRQLETHDKEVRKDVMWAMSNIAAGEVHQGQRLLQHRIFEKVITELKGTNLSIKREAIIAVSNLANKYEVTVTRELLALEVVTAMLESLEAPDTRLQLAILEGLRAILRLCLCHVEFNEDIRRFEEIGGLQRLERLASTANPQVYRSVEGLLNELYGHTPSPGQFEAPSPMSTFAFS